MGTPFPIPVSAAQVGTYFVGQYYQVLQQQPDYVHQFYSNESSVLHVDGSTRKTATAMLQIHSLVMSLNITGIEVKTASSLESLNGGILVMVSGSVQLKNFRRRKFVQTFFLAPQEKGYFILNDIFQFIDEELIHHHPAVLLSQNNIASKLNASTPIPEPVSNYYGGDILGEYVADVNGNGSLEDYIFQEQQLQQAPEPENVLESSYAEESNGSLPNVITAAQYQLPASVEETVEEPQKHTYASILQVAKAQSTPPASSQLSAGKNASAASDRNRVSQPSAEQPVVSSNPAETSDREVEEVPFEDEVEIKSVYVRNLPSTATEYEIEEEFKKFGKICPDGVVIRSRRDVGVCYAFVEYEDMSGVHNAVKEGVAQVAGRQVYIEGRRPNSNIPFRGRGRGRGHSSYQTDAPRGRFGARSYACGSGYDGGDRDYNRSRGNGIYRPSPRQSSRTGHDSDF